MRILVFVLALAGVAATLGAAGASGDSTPTCFGKVATITGCEATAAKLALHSSPLVIRDAGDATAAKLALHSSPPVIRDAGDATAAKLALQSSPASSSPEAPSTASGQKIDWAQLGIGFGVGMFLVLGVILAVRVSRSHRFAH
jgi:hypothetical protein